MLVNKKYMLQIYYFTHCSIFRMLLLFLMMLISGCSLSPSQADLQLAFKNIVPYYADNSIKLVISTTKDLNSYHQRPNSCSLFVIQSERRSQLTKLISDTSLLQGIFNGDQKESGILQINKYALMPGQVMNVSLPRADRTLYVAVVAGYYPSPGPDYSFITAVPMKLKKHGWLFPDYSFELQPQIISMKLGRLNILQAKFTPQDDQYMLTAKKSSVISQFQALRDSVGIMSTSLIKPANKIVSSDIQGIAKKISNGAEK